MMRDVMALETKDVMAIELAELRIEQNGLKEQSLDNIDLPVVEYARGSNDDYVPYFVYGDLTSQDLVFAVSPEGYRVEDKSIKLRLKAQQIAMGETFCVVGVNAYDSSVLGMTRKERKEVATGDFQLYADRVFSVIEALSPNEDQNISVYGYSLGADVSIETVYQNATNENRGIIDISKLAAVEPTRVAKRGMLAVIGAFSSSSSMLFENILDADIPALLEARDINLADPKNSKKHDKSVLRSVIYENLKDIPRGLANIQGAGSDMSKVQLEYLINEDMLPTTTIGQVIGSKVCSDEFVVSLEGSSSDKSQLEIFRIANNDHSFAENIAKSGALMVRSVLFR